MANAYTTDNSITVCVCVCVCMCVVTAYTTRNHHVVDGVKTLFSAQVEDLSSLESQDEFVNLVLHM